MKLTQTIALLTTLLVTTSLHAKWGRIPVMQQKPVNVATKAAYSALSIDSSSGVGQVDNLVNGADITAPASFAAGKSFFIINFGKPVMVATSSIANDGIEGKVALSASADKSGWAVLEERVITAADRSIDFKFAGIQAKFLKYEFILSKGGTLRSLTVHGGQTDYGYALKQDSIGEKGTPMNFVGGLGGARLVYAAPKPLNGIDTAAAFNKFEFPESDEQYRTLIYDFGQTRIMREFSSVHSPAPVRFEVFAFDKLPEKEDWRGRLAFNPADFNVSKPVVASEDRVGTGFMKVRSPRPVKTRYLALRWEPDFNPPAFFIDNVGAVGNVLTVVGQTTQTYTVNGKTVTVTVDPGPAVGGGTNEGNGTVTVVITDPATGTTSTTTFNDAAGVTVTPTSISVQGAPPADNPSAPPPTIAEATSTPGGGLQMTPTSGAPTSPTTSSTTTTGGTGTGTGTGGDTGSGGTGGLGNPSGTGGGPTTPGTPPNTGGSTVVTSP